MSSGVPAKRRQNSQSRKVYYSVLAESSQVCQYLNCPAVVGACVYENFSAHICILIDDGTLWTAKKHRY